MRPKLLVTPVEHQGSTVMAPKQNLKPEASDRGLLITNIALWAAFTIAALACALVSHSMFSRRWTYLDYQAAIGSRWDGEWFYFFGPTVLQTILFCLHLTLILRWQELSVWSNTPRRMGQRNSAGQRLTERSRRWAMATLPLLACLNAIAMVDSLVMVWRVAIKSG